MKRNRHEMDYILVTSIVVCIVVFVLGFQQIIVSVVFLNADLFATELEPVFGNVTVGDDSLLDISKNLANMYIAFGVLNLVLCASTLATQRYDCLKSQHCFILRIAICVVIIAIVIMYLVATVMCFRFINQIKDNSIKKYMLSLLNSNYSGTNVTGDSISNAFNNMFSMYKCCGIDAITATSTGFEKTKWCTEFGTDCWTGKSKIPITCCKSSIGQNTLSDSPSCTGSMETGTYYTMGCFETVTDHIKHRCMSLAVPGTFVIVFQIYKRGRRHDCLLSGLMWLPFWSMLQGYMMILILMCVVIFIVRLRRGEPSRDLQVSTPSNNPVTYK